MEDVKIEKNIPIPRFKGGAGSIVARTLRKMNLGDSIVLPYGKLHSIHTSARCVGVKVRTRKTTEGDLRVWRIE